MILTSLSANGLTCHDAAIIHHLSLNITVLGCIFGPRHFLAILRKVVNFTKPAAAAAAAVISVMSNSV